MLQWTDRMAWSAASALLISGTSLAAVVDSGPVNITVPATIDGVYLNLVAATNGGTGGAVPGWDINPYSVGSGDGLNLFFPSSATHGAVGNAAAASALSTGALIGPASTFTNASTVAAAPFRDPASRFLGIRFVNEAGGGQHYGYIEIESGNGSPPGFPARIRRFVYESVANTAITISQGTRNATATRPTWTQLGDNFSTLSGCRMVRFLI
jgi:hypothetical protein